MSRRLALAAVALFAVAVIFLTARQKPAYTHSRHPAALRRRARGPAAATAAAAAAAAASAGRPRRLADLTENPAKVCMAAFRV